jgi:hypothetical protein
MSRIVELEGQVTRVQWRHPHVRYWPSGRSRIRWRSLGDGDHPA